MNKKNKPGFLGHITERYLWIIFEYDELHFVPVRSSSYLFYHTLARYQVFLFALYAVHQVRKKCET